MGVFACVGICLCALVCVRAPARVLLGLMDGALSFILALFIFLVLGLRLDRLRNSVSLPLFDGYTLPILWFVLGAEGA